MSMTNDDDLRVTTAMIDFGMEVEAFLQSRIGRYLTGRAEDEIEAAVEALKRVDPHDTRAIQAIQNTIHRAESFGYWLAEAIQSGYNAQREFVEQGTD